MTVKELVQTLNELPSKFTIDGITYKVVTADMSDSESIVMIWELSGYKKTKLHYYAFGLSVHNAKESLKEMILKTE